MRAGREDALPLQELPDHVRGTGAGGHPVTDALIVHPQQRRLLEGIVVTHRLDEAAVTR
jgi:hypothetical protein